MTTSIFGELIANFGYLGMILASSFILYLANRADKIENFWYKIFSMLIIMNFMTVHLAAFLVTFILYVMFSIFISIQRRSNNESNFYT